MEPYSTSQYFDGLTWVGPEKAGNPHHLHGYVTKKLPEEVF